MFILSGNSVKGRCGRETNLKDRNGKPLFIGDIVVLFHRDNLGLNQFQGLTAVVDDEYTSYSDGSIVVTDQNPRAFVMGIKDCDIMSENCEWSVERVKSYKRVVDKENWYEYGFNYKKNLND
jgi:hypothetical protein